MKQIRLTCVVGARPNFIKMAALLHAMEQRPSFHAQLVHTGQHMSPEMSQSFFDSLGVRAPDFNLAVSGGSQTEQTAEIMKRIEPVLSENRPDVVLVVGDVTSTVAASLVAAKMGIRIAHVEAGLRSFDRSMPEEINRIVTDALADYLFVTERSGEENLIREGVPRNRIFFTGNVMIDTLLRFREEARRSGVLQQAALDPQKYALVTLHRPSNVDDPERLRSLVKVLKDVNALLPVVFPVHPRTKQRMEAANVDHDGLKLLPPQSYIDFLRLLSDARVVLTDSGGIQEETTILQVPCLTLRENTERPVTIENGTNRLIGTQPKSILAAVTDVISNPIQSDRIPELWDGNAAHRILDVLERVA
jgi:UDP-N-acetylglucosamine 2-epimerase (non-hydrolysing)